MLSGVSAVVGFGALSIFAFLMPGLFFASTPMSLGLSALFTAPASLVSIKSLALADGSSPAGGASSPEDGYCFAAVPAASAAPADPASPAPVPAAVSYTHLTQPTNREV